MRFHELIVLGLNLLTGHARFVVEVDRDGMADQIPRRQHEVQVRMV